MQRNGPRPIIALLASFEGQINIPKDVCVGGRTSET